MIKVAEEGAKMSEARVTIRTGVGLHARPASRLVREAAKHKCEITIEYRDKKAEAKSIIQVLTLAVKDGQEIIIRAEGEGEEAAVASLLRLLNNLGGAEKQP
jgi:phosphocarrier protein